jgi:hypothetical protein
LNAVAHGLDDELAARVVNAEVGRAGDDPLVAVEAAHRLVLEVEDQDVAPVVVGDVELASPGCDA